MATKRGEKRKIDDNERISKRNTEKSNETDKRVRISDDIVEGIYDMICIIFINKKLYTV
jgi:hypothetical protein